MSGTSSPFSLDGRVAVVTGGNRGIGRAIAIGMARAGASVAILARNEEKNGAVRAEIERIGTRAFTRKLDVTDRPSLSPAFEEVERSLGPVDILVNNAGQALPSGGVLNETEANWDAILATHLNATFLLSKLAAASMAKRRGGKIVNMASMYALFGGGLVPSYSAAKGGIVQLTKSMAIELAPHNIQVNALAPGWIATDMTTMVRESKDWTEFNRMILARTPAGRWGEADDCAGVAVFLASRASDFITGVTIHVDGGYSVF